MVGFRSIQVPLKGSIRVFIKAFRGLGFRVWGLYGLGLRVLGLGPLKANELKTGSLGIVSKGSVGLIVIFVFLGLVVCWACGKCGKNLVP